MTGDELKEQDSRGVDAVEWNNPPLEGQLADKTIWPGIIIITAIIIIIIRIIIIRIIIIMIRNS